MSTPIHTTEEDRQGMHFAVRNLLRQDYSITLVSAMLLNTIQRQQWGRDNLEDQKLHSTAHGSRDD